MSQGVNVKRNTGFTIIELTLAMTFISLLLLAIALTIVQIANTYNKGTLTKDLNQTSRELADELQSAVNGSNTFTSSQFVSQDWGGRLCVGKYSYVWNYAPAIAPTSMNTNRAVFLNPSTTNDSTNPLAFNKVTVGSTTKYEINMVKVQDTASALCIKDASTGKYPAVDQTKATELLRTGEHSFGLYDLSVDTSSTATDTVSGQQLYKLSFVLGTTDLSAVKTTGGDRSTTACIAAGQSGADPDYCNVQKFTLVLRVAGGVN